MHRIYITIVFCAVAVAGLTVFSGLSAGEPAGTGVVPATGTAQPTTGSAAPTGTGKATTPTTGKPKAARKIRVYIKGADTIEQLDNSDGSGDFSSRFILQCFELTQSTKRIVKKYNKHFPNDNGWRGLRERLEISVSYDNLYILRPGMHKWKKDDKGKWQKLRKYTDAELVELADYVVESSSNAKYKPIFWYGKLICHRYDAVATIKVTDQKTGKVIFENTGKADNTGQAEKGKKRPATKSIRDAATPIGIEIIHLDVFKKALCKSSKKPEKSPDE